MIKRIMLFIIIPLQLLLTTIGVAQIDVSVATDTQDNDKLEEERWKSRA
ncbi:hypothetical protein JXB12_05670 [candidate division KSB1 bacterium]|nr:hypothetical protein [candidate division KSB1 bacterium]